MKKIAITQRLIQNQDYHEIREALDINYAKLLEECGFLPIILPYECDFKKYFKKMRIDGIVLTGGNDLYLYNNNELSKKRDKFEYKLISYAIKKDIQILGICRGMQIVADYFGNKLIKVDKQINIKHTLIINKESKLKKELSKLKKVNSFHSYAIEDINKEFIVSAKNKQGIIKAIEHKKYKIFCQMWHTERNTPFNKNEINVIKKLFGD